MADNMIELVASLNVSDSAEQINKVDIPLLQKKIEGIKIKCELDTNGIASIQSQLANIKINAPQIDLGVGSGSELINNVSHIVDNVEDKIEELRKNLAEKFKVSVDKIITSTIKNAKGQINSFSFDLTKLSGEVEKFSYKVSRTKQENEESGKDYTVTSVKAIGSRDSDKGAIQLLEKATKAANTLERQMINLKAAADDVSASRPITSQESIDKVAQAYKNAETAVGNLRTANSSTFEELNNEAKKAVDELNNVIKAQRNADTAATKLRAKPIEVVKADELSNLDKFVATISNSAIPDVTNLTQRVEGLRSELSEVNDKQGLVDYLNKFTNVESDFKALVAQTKAVKSALSDLDNLSNNALFQKNKSNSQISSTLSDIENIRKEYGQLFAEIGNAKTPEDLQKISNKLAELKPQFDKVVNSANQFKTALKAENIDAGLANRIKRLTADVNSYATANKRAIESTKQMTSGVSFAEEWERITSVMAKGAELTDSEIKDLSTDIAVFKKEADAAGLSTSAFFKDMGTQLKQVITQWINLNAVISKIKEMVTNVINIDTAMTDLKKVTDETDATYNRFLDETNVQAKNLHSTMSDLIKQTAEWSKLGYSLDEAQKLAETSMIYSKVGEVDNATSVNNLVTAMKAYNIEANDLIEVVDRLNKLGNEFSTDAGALGEGLSVSASTLAMAGNDLSQSLALITGGTEITQNASEMGNAIRTISLRIRGMKGELEELNEETDGIESISKIQTQILNLTNNKVNIFDDNENFRSTYDILKDISEVYGDLSSTSQASLTEILFGKTRANQGNAIIQAFQSGQIEKAYEAAENSAGSAQTEFNKMSESIESHINDLKEAWEHLSSDVIDSDAFKTLIDMGTGLLNLSDKIIENFGTIPTLLTSIVAVKTIKDGGIFGQISKDSNNVLETINSLKQVLQYDFGKTYKDFNIDLSGLKDADINALQTYVNWLGDADVSQETLLATMDGMSDAAKAQTIGFNQLNLAYQQGAISQAQYANATQNLALTQRTATTTSKALSIALKTITSIGIMVALNLAITGISELVNAEKEAQEKAEEARKAAVERAEAYTAEVNSLTNLQNQYIQLAATTSDLTSEQEKLSSIQQDINNNISNQKEQVDLLNGSLAENLALMKKQAYEDAKVTQRDNKTQYEHAVESLNSARQIELKVDDDFETYKYIKAIAGDSIFESPKGFLLASEEALLNRENIPLEEQLALLDKIIEGYKDYDYYNTEVYDSLVQQRKELGNEYDSMMLVKNAFEDAGKIINSYESIPEETFSEYDSLIQKAEEYKAIVLGEGSATEKFIALDNLQDTKEELYSLIDGNETLKAELDTFFESVDSKLSNTKTSAETLFTEWKENLDSTHKDTMDNLDTLNDALETLTNGENLSWDELKEIAWEIDDEGIIQTITQVGDEYSLTTDEIIALKEAIINKTVEQIEVENDAAEAQRETYQATIDYYQKLLDKWNYSENPITDPANRKKIEEYKDTIDEAQESYDALGDEISRNNVLINKYNSYLDNTVYYYNQLETSIQNTIDALEDQKDILNDQLDDLNDQLDVLEEQEDELNDIIDDYESVATIVTDAIQDQIDAIEDSRGEMEDYYDSLIDNLEEEKSKLEEANEERQDAIDMVEKLAALENAKNNKVRTYDEARGWIYEVNKEDLESAQNDLDEAINSQKVSELEKQIDTLEDEKDEALAIFDKQKEELESYKEAWEDAANSITEAENEILAQEILGADWRERITKQDIALLNQYESEYKSYNTQLTNLTNNEIAALEASIEAKEDEIDSIEDTIDSWEDYKDTVQEAADNYSSAVNSMSVSNSTLKTTKSNIESVADAIGLVASTLSDNLSGSLDEATTKSKSFFDTIKEKLDEVKNGINAIEAATSATDVGEAIGNTFKLVGSHAEGGVNSTTGLAMLHGTKQRSEVIFNAKDATKLYEMVHTTPNLIADIMSKADVIRGINASKTNTNNNAITINIAEVRANNPVELTKQLDPYLEGYFRKKLTESYVQ